LATKPRRNYNRGELENYAGPEYSGRVVLVECCMYGHSIGVTLSTSSSALLKTLDMWIYKLAKLSII